MAVKLPHVLAGTMLLVAGGIALVATKSVGNVQLNKYVEVRGGPLQEHIVSTDELNMSRTFSQPKFPMRYPGQVAAGISQCVQKGFAPLYQPSDPQVAALPAEAAQ